MICSLNSVFKRIGLAILIFVAFVIFEIVFHELFGFIKDPVLLQAESSFIAATVLFAVFYRIQPVTTRFEMNNPETALFSILIIAAPFLVIALLYNPEFIGISGEWLIFAGALVLLAAMEEILCRGLFMDVLSFRGKWEIGVFLSSLLFSLLHILNSNLSFIGLFNIFLAGIMLGLLRMTTGGLALPTLVHWFWNFFIGMIFGWSVSGHKIFPTLIRCESTPLWGDFGPEESWLLTLSLLGSILYLSIYLKKQNRQSDLRVASVTDNNPPDINEIS